MPRSAHPFSARRFSAPPSGYAAILRREQVLRVLLAASLGRLSYAMASLALLLTVQEATGSYATAGLAVGGYALASVVMPLKSRLVDRRGATAVLPWLSVGFSASLLALALLASAGRAGPLAFVGLAVAAGLLAPPLGPSMRAVWAALTPEPEVRRRAYSLDGVVEEVLFALAPLAVAALLVVGSGAAAAAATALANLVGTLALMGTATFRRHSRARATATPSGWTGPVLRPGFALLLLVVLGVGLATGPLEVSLVARSDAVGRPEDVGSLLAALSVGSTAGGLLWGQLVRAHHPRRQLAALVAGLGAALAALVPVHDRVAAAAVLLLVGLLGSPVLITAYLTADDLALDDQQREASTWVSSVANLGLALGAGAAGLLVDRQGADLALAAGVVACALTVLVVLGAGTRLTRIPPDRPPG